MLDKAFRACLQLFINVLDIKAHIFFLITHNNAYNENRFQSKSIKTSDDVVKEGKNYRKLIRVKKNINYNIHFH